MEMARQVRRSLSALALACVLPGAACSASRAYLWVEEVQPTRKPEKAEYRISAGDVIGVRVWNQESMSTPRARVREDGKVSLPFLQDVDAAGMTPDELSSRLAVKLKSLVVSPVVTITLEERRPLRVSVLGEVTRAGTYDLQQGGGVLEALAAAGGLTQWADRNGIYVLRQGYWADGHPEPARIRFRYSRLASGSIPATTFQLQPGDVVVVE